MPKIPALPNIEPLDLRFSRIGLDGDRGSKAGSVLRKGIAGVDRMPVIHSDEGHNKLNEEEEDEYDEEDEEEDEEGEEYDIDIEEADGDDEEYDHDQPNSARHRLQNAIKQELLRASAIGIVTSLTTSGAMSGIDDLAA